MPVATSVFRHRLRQLLTWNPHPFWWLPMVLGVLLLLSVSPANSADLNQALATFDPPSSSSVPVATDIGLLVPNQHEVPSVSQFEQNPDDTHFTAGDAFGNSAHNTLTIQLALDPNRAGANGVLVRYSSVDRVEYPDDIGHFVPFIHNQQTYTVTFRNSTTTPILPNTRYWMAYEYAVDSETKLGATFPYETDDDRRTASAPHSGLKIRRPIATINTSLISVSAEPQFTVVVSPQTDVGFNHDDYGVNFANGLVVRYREVGSTVWLPSNFGTYEPYNLQIRDTNSGPAYTYPTTQTFQFTNTAETPIKAGVEYEVEYAYAIDPNNLISPLLGDNAYSSTTFTTPDPSDYHPQNISITHNSDIDQLTVNWSLPELRPQVYVDNNQPRVHKYKLRYRVAGTEYNPGGTKEWSRPNGVNVGGARTDRVISSCTDDSMLSSGEHCIEFSRGNTYIIEMAQADDDGNTLPTGGDADWAIAFHSIPYTDTPTGPRISSIEINPIFEQEGHNATLNIRLDSPVMTTASVSVFVDETMSNTADLDDIDLIDTTLEFLPNQDFKFARININNDSEIELNEHIYFGIYNEKNLIPSTLPSQKLTIVDATTVAISAELSAAPTPLSSEGVLPVESGTISITFRLSLPIDSSCSFPWSINDIGQINNVSFLDYELGQEFGSSLETTVFAPGETEKIYTLELVNDSIPERDERLELRLPSTVGYNDAPGVPTHLAAGFDCGEEYNRVLAPNVRFPTATPGITIAGNDEPVINSLDPGNGASQDLDRALQLEFGDGGADEKLIRKYKVRYTSNVDTDNPTNTIWIDNEILKTEKSITIPFTENRVRSSGERLDAGSTYWVQVASLVGRLGTNELKYEIWSDLSFATTGAEITPVVTVDDVNEGSPFVVNAEIPSALSQDVTIAVQLESAGGTNGAEPQDIDTNTHDLVITSGQTTGSVSIPTISDEDFDEEEVLVSLSTTDLITLPSNPTATITEQLSAVPSGLVANAGDGSTPVRDADRAFSVSWTDSSGPSDPTVEAFEIGWVVKPTDGSTPADDQWDTARTTEVTTTSLVVPTGNRLLPTGSLEPNTTYLVRVSSVATDFGQKWSAPVEVTTAPAIELTITVTPDQIIEGELMTVTATLSQPLSGDLAGTIILETGEEDNSLTSDHSDFDLTNDRQLPVPEFTIPAGTSQAMVTFGTDEDDEHQHETFRLSVNGLSEFRLVGSDWSEEVTIFDDDLPKVTSVTLKAGDGQNRDQDRSLSVSWTISEDTVEYGIAGYVVAYRLAAANGNPAGEWSEPIEVAGGNTTASAVLTPVGGLTAGLYEVQVGSAAQGIDTAWSETSNQATITDPITLSFTSTTVAVSESNSDNDRTANFEVGLSGLRSEQVNYRIRFGNDTTDNSDLDVATQISRGIEAGMSTDRPFVTIHNDDVVEGDEVFEAILSLINGEVAVNSQRARVTISDNDTAEVGLEAPSVLTAIEDVDGGTQHQFVFTITISKEVAADVTMDWELSGAKTTDVVGGQTEGTITFSSGSTTPQMVTITVADDTEKEAAEEWTFSLSSLDTALTREQGPDPVSFTSSVADVVLNIEASDLALGPAVTNVTATQGDSEGLDPDSKLSVSWTAAPGEPGYVVEYAQDSSRTVLEGLSLATWTDWTEVSPVTGLSATISDLQVAQGQYYRFRVATEPDDLTIPNWQLSNVISLARPIEVSLGSMAEQVDENDAAVEITVGLSGRKSETVSVMVVVSTEATDTASSPSDFGEPTFDSTIGSAGSVQVDFAAADDEATVRIPIVNDSVVEGTETFTVSLGTSPTDNVEVSTNSASVSVDDDDVAEVGIEITATEVEEDRANSSDPNNSVGLTLTLNAMVSEPVTVNLTVSGSNIDADDIGWTDLTQMITIPPNTVSHPVSLEIVDDDVAEEAEALVVTVSNPQVSLEGRTAADVLSIDTNSNSVTATITKSDGGIFPPEVSGVTAIAGQTVGAHQVDDDRMISVSWTVPDEASLVVGYVSRFVVAPTDGSIPADGDWTLGDRIEDPTATSATLTANEGISANTTYWVEVSALKDDINSVIYSWVRADASVSTDEAVTVSLHANATVAESRTDPNANNTITLTASLTGLLSVPVELTVSTTAGTATAADDYVALATEPITVTAGEMSAGIQIEVIEDMIVEGTETFTAEIVGTPTGAEIDDTASQVSIEITDDDQAEISLSISDNGNSVNTINTVEDRTANTDPNHTVQLNLNLSRQVAAEVEVTLTVSGANVSADDIGWTGLVEQVTISVGMTSHTVNLEIVDDDISEQIETLMVTVSDPVVTLPGRTGAVQIDSNADAATVVVAASDGGHLPPLVSGVSVEVGQMVGANRVDTDRLLSISWSVPADLAGVVGYVPRFVAAPAGGAVPAPEDWRLGSRIEDPAATSAILTAADGLLADTEYLVAVSALRDDINTEVYNWVQASTSATTAEAVQVSLSTSDTTVAEARSDPTANNTITVTASLNGLLSVPVTLEVSTTADSATDPDDFAGLVTESITIAAGQNSASVQIEIVEDEVVEGTETFTVGIVGSPTGTNADTTADQVTIDISDDDTALVSVMWAGTAPTSGALPAVEEDVDGGTPSELSYNIVLDKQVTTDVVVDWELATTSEVTATDFVTTPLSGQFTIVANSPAGHTETVSIVVADDSDREPQEQVRLLIRVTPVNLSGRTDTPVAADAAASEVVAIITASDQPDLTILPTNVMVSAGDSSGRDTDRSLTVSWTAPTNATNVTGYLLRYKLVTAEEWSEPVSVSGADTLTHTWTPSPRLAPGSYLVSVESVGVPAHDPVTSPQTATITDPITVSVAPSSLTVPEGRTLPLTFTLSGERSEVVSVRVTTTGGTASGNDFTVPAQVSFAVGETTVSVDVEASEDETVEGTETFTVGIGTIPSGESVDMAADEVSIEITDDDTALVSVVWAGAVPTGGALPAVEEDVDGGTPNELTYRIVLDKSVATEVTVDWEIVTGSQITTSDFETSPLSGRVSFPAGSVAGHSVELSVVVADDTDREPQEQVRFQISNPAVTLSGRTDTPVQLDPTASEVLSTISASDQPDQSQLPTNVVVSAGDELGRDTDRTLTASWSAPSDPSGVTGYALRYKLVTAAEWSAPITVDGVNTLNHTWTPEPRLLPRDYQVSVEAAGAPAHDPVSSSQPATITDPITASITETSLNITEGSSGSLTLTLSGERSVGVTIRISVTPSTATDDDYTVPEEVMVGVGETAATIMVLAASDDEDEPDETFTIALNSPSLTGGIVADTSPVRITIANAASPSSPGGGGSPVVPDGSPTGSPTGNGQSPGTNPGSQTGSGGGGVGGIPSGGGGGGPTVNNNFNITNSNVTIIQTTTQVGTIVFTDVSGNSHQDNIAQLASMGITRGCNPPENTIFCPDRAVTRGEMATFMVRAFALAETSDDLFGDDDGSTHESNINALATAEITRGCNPPENTRYCPDRPVTRAQMATFIARALSLDAGSGDFSDTTTSVHSSDINRIANVGITRGCNPPANTRYCPDRPVNRAEMATFLIRSTDLQDEES